MSNNNNESLYEKVQERLDSDRIDALLWKAEGSVSDFLCWIEDNIGQDKMNDLMKSWILTKDGRKWYDATLQRMFEDRQDSGPEHDE